MDINLYELKLTTPIINYNGGLVTNKHNEKFKPYSLTIPKEYVIDIFESNKEVIENFGSKNFF